MTRIRKFIPQRVLKSSPPSRFEPLKYIAFTPVFIFLIFFIGLILPMIVPFFWLVFVGAAILARATQKKKKRLGWGATLSSLLTVLFVSTGFCAPARALALWVLTLPFPWSDETLSLLGPKPLFETFVGACGILLAVVGGAMSARTIWRQMREVGNLPTSKARSAALGLAEFKGVARRDDREEPLAQSKATGRFPPGGPTDDPDAILYSDWGSYQGESNLFERWTSFYLEDASGRILVDPRGVDFLQGQGSFIFEPFCKIFLTGRVTKSLSRITRALMPGDRVYLIGAVEIDPAAPLDATDSARLVVRPSTQPTSPGLIDRLLFGGVEPGSGKSVSHLFYLADSDEKEAEDVLRWSLHQAWLQAAVWLGFSLWLFLAYRPLVKWPRVTSPLDLPAVVSIRESLSHAWRRHSFVRKLESPDPRVRLDAARGLGDLGFDAATTLPDLKRHQDDFSEDPNVRNAAMHAIRKIKRATDPRSNTKSLWKIPSLLKNLDDPDPDVRAAAAESLGAIGPVAYDAAWEPLHRLTEKDPFYKVRAAAYAALLRINPPNDNPGR